MYMSLDGIVSKAIVKELNNTILGGRIDKVYQPEKDELLLNIYNKGNNYKLIISSNSNNPRIHLTDKSKINPSNPPMFCMLLRKHIAGGIILNIEQFHMDRILFIDISSIDELGLPSEKRLVVEIMGKHSNIVLIEKEDSKIIDSIKRVSRDISRVRQILPGLEYQYPPLQNKKDPLCLNEKDFYTLMDKSKPNTYVYKFFYTNYMGLSPLISKEICYVSNIDIDRPIISLSMNEKEILLNTFISMMEKVQKEEYTPVLVYDQIKPGYKAFHALDLSQFGNYKKEYSNSISNVLDKFYLTNDTMERLKQKSHSIKKSIETKLERSLNKLSKQKEELLKSKDREKYKIYGDLISANIYKIKKGAKDVSLENFYSENMDTITIPLNPKYSAAENAQRYYKKYSKLKNAHTLLLKEIPKTEEEIEYLENVLNSIDNCTEIIELEEIKDELIKEGYLKPYKNNKNKKKKIPKSKPHHYISSDGFHIYVGKNNRQNEYLTLRMANKDDMWLHAQKIPGSHVIIRKSKEFISDTALEEGALLAAYYSKAKYSTNVAVDYTEKKNVKKPKNAKTGMVIYENFNTIIVTPEYEKIKNLKKVED